MELPGEAKCETQHSRSNLLPHCEPEETTLGLPALSNRLSESIHKLKITIHPVMEGIRKSPISVSGNISLQRWEKLTNARQLFAKHYIEYPGAADLRLHQHHAGVFGDDFSDDGGIPAKRVLSHLPKNCLCHFRNNHGHQLSFIGYVEWVKAQYLARTLHRFAHWNRLLAQRHAHAGTLGDFVQRGSRAAAGGIAQAVDEVRAAGRRC